MKKSITAFVDEIAPNRVVVDRETFYEVDHKPKTKIYWYQTWDARNHEHFWWTQRDENGVCFEIRKKSDGFWLYKCEKFISKHGALQSAMDEAAAQWASGRKEGVTDVQ